MNLTKTIINCNAIDYPEIKTIVGHTEDIMNHFNGLRRAYQCNASIVDDPIGARVNHSGTFVLDHHDNSTLHGEEINVFIEFIFKIFREIPDPTLTPLSWRAIEEMRRDSEWIDTVDQLAASTRAGAGNTEYIGEMRTKLLKIIVDQEKKDQNDPSYNKYQNKINYQPWGRYLTYLIPAAITATGDAVSHQFQYDAVNYIKNKTRLDDRVVQFSHVTAYDIACSGFRALM